MDSERESTRGDRVSTDHLHTPELLQIFLQTAMAHRRLCTEFTSLLSVRVPVCSAPMAGAAGGALAAAVHKAGAFGFISAVSSSLDHTNWMVYLTPRSRH